MMKFSKIYGILNIVFQIFTGSIDPPLTPSKFTGMTNISACRKPKFKSCSSWNKNSSKRHNQNKRKSFTLQTIDMDLSTKSKLSSAALVLIFKPSIMLSTRQVVHTFHTKNFYSHHVVFIQDWKSTQDQLATLALIIIQVSIIEEPPT